MFQVCNLNALTGGNLHTAPMQTRLRRSPHSVGNKPKQDVLSSACIHSWMRSSVGLCANIRLSSSLRSPVVIISAPLHPFVSPRQVRTKISLQALQISVYLPQGEELWEPREEKQERQE